MHLDRYNLIVAVFIYFLVDLLYLYHQLQGGKAAAVVRGPIATRILNQLLLATEWGDLDYLVTTLLPICYPVFVLMVIAITEAVHSLIASCCV